MKVRLLRRSVVASLSPDLLKPKYRKKCKGKHRTFGHCYAASEALLYLLGGRRSGYRAEVLRIRGGTHWYLRNKRTGKVLDVTEKQFAAPVNYQRGNRCPFLTKEPSKRARTIIKRVRARLASSGP